MPGKVFLIPTVLHQDDQALHTLPAYIANAVKNCKAFFVENEKTARRFLKKIWPEMVIDDYAWLPIQKKENTVIEVFIKHISQNEYVAIISEAGCPGIADPGQILVHEAQKRNIQVVPFVGPNAILMALMASGMNGQRFEFMGYVPIESNERKKAFKDMESSSAIKNKTFIFIETPYRNNSLLKDIVQACMPGTKLCIAVNISGASEMIKTKTIKEWQASLPDIHKQPAIFLLYAGTLQP